MSEPVPRIALMGAVITKSVWVDLHTGGFNVVEFISLVDDPAEFTKQLSLSNLNQMTGLLTVLPVYN
jgi:hypothetical protein